MSTNSTFVRNYDELDTHLERLHPDENVMARFQFGRLMVIDAGVLEIFWHKDYCKPDRFAIISHLDGISYLTLAREADTLIEYVVTQH